MLIKSIKLHNIRSYEDAEIKFPIGSVLLAGDIGSGKSTILLAIEFAIFGAKKGELPAYTLLRHGRKEGSVELRIHIDNKDITIKRTLKRSNEDIKQEAGYVIMNGLKKDGTTEELRAIVLELLGYPKDLIKKGKDLIYRYTVYTPQEEMKQILYESKETRLDTLRKVFNIDKYKRIKENSKIIAASLKEKKKHYEGYILNLDYKMKELQERKSEIAQLEKGIIDLEPKIDEIKGLIGEKKKSILDIETDMSELNKLRKDLSVTEANLAHLIQQNNRLNEEIKKLDLQIDELKKDAQTKKLEDMQLITAQLELKEKEANEADASYRNAIRKIKEFEVKTENSMETMKKMQSLEICPLCEQKVDEKHKHDVNLRESKKYEDFLRQLKNHQEEESKLSKVKIGLKKELDLLVKEQNHLNILKIRLESIGEKQALNDEKAELKEKVRKEVGLLNAKKIGISKKIEMFSTLESKYKSIRKELDELMPQERFLELEKKKYETEKGSIARFIIQIEKEISEKQKAKANLAYTLQLINWIDGFFVNLMATVEKHVMVNIHSQFNELFRNWFDMLIEDETISVRVDEEFTPVIEQDGYETYVENLSGGEKTAVALSYRLALNKVINDIVEGIKTRELIMLDEPTDGFSSEQLDKVRDILEQLNMKQVIIVSHESKIESFVENVIRVEKQDSVSVVI